MELHAVDFLFFIPNAGDDFARWDGAHLQIRTQFSDAVAVRKQYILMNI